MTNATLILASFPISGDGVQAPGAVVLRELGGQYVTHFFNAQDGGYYHGHYFPKTLGGFTDAAADFKSRCYVPGNSIRHPQAVDGTVKHTDDLVLVDPVERVAPGEQPAFIHARLAGAR